MGFTIDLGAGNNNPVSPLQPAAAGSAAPRGTAQATSEQSLADTVGAVAAGGAQDGVTLAYDAGLRVIDATNTDKGTVAVAAHEALGDPHPQYETAVEVTAKIVAHSAAADPHGDRAYAVSILAAHEADADPHPGYLTQAEADALYAVLAHNHALSGLSDVDVTGIADGDVLAWDLGTGTWVPIAPGSGGGVTDHGALTGLGDDDHPQYHNDARGDARYDAIGTGAAAVAAHVALADPHTQYLQKAGGTMTGQLLGAAGVATPGFSFAGDTNTGIGSNAADELRAVAGGTSRGLFSPAVLSGGARLGLDTTSSFANVDIAYMNSTSWADFPGLLIGGTTGPTGLAGDLILKARSGASARGIQMWVGSTPTAQLVLPVTGGVQISGVLDVGGASRVGNGTAAAPAVTFTGDNDTGMYRSASNVLGFAAGGSLTLEVSPVAALFHGQLRLLAGTTTAPAAAHASSTNTGWWFPGVGQQAWSCGGVQVLSMVSTAVTALVALRAPSISLDGGTNVVSSLASGAYTPTVTVVANIDSTSAPICQWQRVGNVVTVSGRMASDATTSGVLTQFRLSLPVAAVFSNPSFCCGAGAVDSTTAIISCRIEGDITNNEAALRYYAPGTGNYVVTFTFTYRVA